MSILWDLRCSNIACLNFMKEFEVWVDNDVLPSCTICKQQLTKCPVKLTKHISWSQWQVG